MSQPVAHNTFDFIVTFKLWASPELFQRTKQVKVWRGKVWAVRWTREQFPAQVVDGLHRLGCCVRPCIVMMQDDSFRLMTSAFVLYAFFAFVLYVYPMHLFFIFVHYETCGTYTTGILLWISTPLRSSATKNLITDLCSILSMLPYLTFLFITKTLKLFILICKGNFIQVNKKKKKKKKNLSFHLDQR